MGLYGGEKPKKSSPYRSIDLIELIVFAIE